MNVSFVESLENRDFFSAAPVAACPKPAPTPNGTAIMTQQRKQDGSCITATANTASATALQTKTQARLRDGSCTTATATVSATATQDKIQKQDRLRDGSCKL